jgi:hypothetical protein
MGAGASIPEELDIDAVRSLAGDRFDEAKWNSIAVDGKITKEQLNAASNAPAPVLRGVPALPTNFSRRAGVVEEVCTLLRGDGCGSLALQGEGGLGKTVIASAVVRAQELCSTFPGGVCWLTVGATPSILSLQIELARMLDDVGIIQDVGEGKSKLSALLSGKNMVVVLDDCWELKHADAFPTNVEGSVFLVTTRIKSLLPSATEFQLGRLSDTEGCALLDTGVTDAAIEVLDICTRLPLALAVIGAVHKIGAGLSMVDIASAMRRTTVDAGSPNAAAFRALTLGVEQLSPGERSLYVDLAVYPEDVWVPVAVIVRFATSRRSGSAEKNSSAGKKCTPQVGGADKAANEAANEAADEAADVDPLLMSLLTLARRQLLKLKGVPPAAITDPTSSELDPALRQALSSSGAMVGLHDNPSIRYWANMNCATCTVLTCTVLTYTAPTYPRLVCTITSVTSILC